MKIIHSVEELKREVHLLKIKGKSIGFVPTMGFLHDGHASLMRESVKENDCTIVSIFVNPAQFNDPKDFEKYPRNTEADSILCEKEKVDIIFLPEVTEMYPDGYKSGVELKIPHLMQNMCAVTRPGHFEGVLLVVSRLFHFVSPDTAYFGKKDYQQYLIIREFAKQLGFGITIKGIETIREKDGLAMSSRNSRLSAKEREIATLLHRALKIGEEYSQKKSATVQIVREVVRDVILSSVLTKIDYIEILDPNTLSPKEELFGDILIGLAVFIGEIRLIDNFQFRI